MMRDNDNHTLTAVDKLTQPWGHTFGPKDMGPNTYQRVEYNAMLDTLREAISSSTGKTVGGASPANSRNVLNLHAFELWENIDGLIRSWAQRLDVPTDTDVKALLRRVYIKVNATTDDEKLPLRFERMVRGWVFSIDEMFDPPITKELTARCPKAECGARKVKDEHGDLQAALIAYYRTEQQPAAKCRACGALWEGERELLELGFSIRATVDVEALKEMGVIA